MKVGELLARLAACDPEAEVLLGYEGIQKYTVGTVEPGWVAGLPPREQLATGSVRREAWVPDEPPAPELFSSAEPVVPAVVLRAHEDAGDPLAPPLAPDATGHRAAVAAAAAACDVAFASAVAHGRRTDCLRVARAGAHGAARLVVAQDEGSEA